MTEPPRIDPDLLAKMLAQIAAKQRQRSEWPLRYGAVRPPVSAHFDGSRMIAVGTKIYRYDHNGSWHGFLYEHLLSMLGEEWCAAQNGKPFEQAHIIARWLGEALSHEASTKASAGSHAPLTPGVWAARSLAYDTFCVQQHQTLPSDVLHRLRHADQFEGARYEMWVAACFVRAGFKIEFEDEADRKTTHCEFRAKHPAYSKWYAVEAKRRHRPIDDLPGRYQRGDFIKLDINRLLAAALAKKADHQRLIFLDMNMPPISGGLSRQRWLPEFIASRKVLQKQRRFRPPDGPNAFVFATNHPYHYLTTEVPDPLQHMVIATFNLRHFDRNPSLVRSEHPAVTHLASSISAHFDVPSDFPPPR